MSINSKARRDARKRQAAKARATPVVRPTPSIEPHAQLRDPSGQLLGGIVRRDGEWTLGLGGQIVGGSDSPARVLAMLKRAAVLHEREGTQVRMTCSTALQVAAAQDVAGQGLSFEQFEAQLAQELASGLAPPLEHAPPDGQVRH